MVTIWPTLTTWWINVFISTTGHATSETLCHNTSHIFELSFLFTVHGRFTPSWLMVSISLIDLVTSFVQLPSLRSCIGIITVFSTHGTLGAVTYLHSLFSILWLKRWVRDGESYWLDKVILTSFTSTPVGVFPKDVWTIGLLLLHCWLDIVLISSWEQPAVTGPAWWQLVPESFELFCGLAGGANC